MESDGYIKEETMTLGQRCAGLALSVILLSAVESNAGIVDHWNQSETALTGADAVALFNALNAEVQWNNGGFRQPSRMKNADWGKLSVFCDTHASAVCLIRWTGAPYPTGRIEITAAELNGRTACSGDFSFSDSGITIECGARGFVIARRLAGITDTAPTGTLAVHWCEDRTIDNIQICLTRSDFRTSRTFPLEKFYLRLPGAEPVVVTVGPGEPGPSQKTGNIAFDGGAGDASWMGSIGYGSDGKLYSVLISWSYFILSGNPDMRNVYIKNIRELDGDREILNPDGKNRAIRMKAVSDIAAVHPEFR